MGEEIFRRFAPFIQEYIYKNRWDELKGIQVKAAKAIFETNTNIIISSGTASGKTEAAFFPILSEIYNEDINSVSVLYIGPLKALINDQFERIKDILERSDIPVCHWHGDSSATAKKKLISKPRGILQITPESLESLLINQPQIICTMFSELRYIIIDEVHIFMGSDRGSQLLCQLYKINKLINKEPRRIGLSATLGDTSIATEWICYGVNNQVIIIESNEPRRLAIGVEYFNVEIPEERNEMINYVHENTKGQKAIIFTNSRSMAEDIIVKLRKNAKRIKTPDIYYIHHGSLSMALRREVEEALKDSSEDTVAAATVTLELGIDIGDLDKTLQMGAPNSCSSFVQRLGRSGRRSGYSKMLFITSEEREEDPNLMGELHLELLQIIAVIELYLKDKWIEPVTGKTYPYSLLYQQTLSALATFGEMEPRELARTILMMPSFINITKEDYKALLTRLIELEHIQKTAEGGLIIGLEGEKLISNFRFFAIFPEEEEYKVYVEGNEIGKINKLPPINTCFSLGGRSWKVTEIITKKNIVHVSPVTGKQNNLFLSAPRDVHDKIISKMKDVLLCDDLYPYLSPKSSYRLNEMRNAVLEKDTANSFSNNYIPVNYNTFYYVPWVGTKKMKTLERIFSLDWIANRLGIKKFRYVNFICFYIMSDLDIYEFDEALKECISEIDNAYELVESMEQIPDIDKYDYLLPYELLVKEYAYNQLDFEGLRETLLG